jgi:4-hydroxybenzoate polyprenyltransferase
MVDARVVFCARVNAQEGPDPGCVICAVCLSSMGDNAGLLTADCCGGFGLTLFLLTTGCEAGCGAAYYASLVVGAAQLAWQIATVDLDSRPDCLAKFNSNKWFGAAVFAGIVADRLLSQPG